MTEKILLDSKFNVDKEAYDSFVDFVARWVDIFSSDYVGYWAYGEPVGDADCQYLLYDMADDRKPTGEESAAAVAAYRAKAELPEHWYAMDLDTAHKITVAGLTKFGENFLDEYDGDRLDSAVQLALLGEVVYG